MPKRIIAGIDVFCGVGGLTYGLQKAGVLIVAGIDRDSSCEFPFTSNNDVPFINADVNDVTADDLVKAQLMDRSLVAVLVEETPHVSLSPEDEPQLNARERLRLHSWKVSLTNGRRRI